MKRLALFLLALTAAAGLAACGGGGDQLSKEEYEERLTATGTTLEETFGNLAIRLQALQTGEIGSVEDVDELLGQMADEVNAGVTALDEAVSDLDDIEPPAEVADTHDKLVEGIRLLSGDFSELADAIEEGEFRQIQDIAGSFQDIATSDAGRLIQEATTELEEKGYDLDGGDE